MEDWFVFGPRTLEECAEEEEGVVKRSEEVSQLAVTPGAGHHLNPRSSSIASVVANPLIYQDPTVERHLVQEI